MVEIAVSCRSEDLMDLKDLKNLKDLKQELQGKKQELWFRISTFEKGFPIESSFDIGNPL